MSTLTIHPQLHRQIRTASPVRPASTVRLTRRGRLVIFLGALALLMLAAVAMGAGSVASGEAGSPSPSRVVVINEGDTLWGLASEAADGGDVRAMEDTIIRMNALESPMLMVGQRVRVPVTQ